MAAAAGHEAVVVEREEEVAVLGEDNVSVACLYDAVGVHATCSNCLAFACTCTSVHSHRMFVSMCAHVMLVSFSPSFPTCVRLHCLHHSLVSSLSSSSPLRTHANHDRLSRVVSSSYSRCKHQPVAFPLA